MCVLRAGLRATDYPVFKVKANVMILHKSAFKYHGLLGKCSYVVFSVEPRKGDGRAENCNDMRSAPHCLFCEDRIETCCKTC